MGMRTECVLVVVAVACASALGLGCDKKSSGGDTAASSAAASGGGAAAAAPGASKHKLKTTLTSKQLEDVYASTIKGNNDFKKHGDLVTAKLGKPAKVDGDQSFWFGVVPANGAMSEDCMQLSTSATKGSGTQTTNGDDKCWEK